MRFHGIILTELLRIAWKRVGLTVTVIPPKPFQVHNI